MSSPTAVALHLIKPDLLIVPADTLSPNVLSTGILSPVRADSSTAVLPSVISASTGILSPGRTTNTSPFSPYQQLLRFLCRQSTRLLFRCKVQKCLERICRLTF